MLKAKRLLTDKEFDELVSIEDTNKKKKYLDKLKEELWDLKTLNQTTTIQAQDYKKKLN